MQLKVHVEQTVWANGNVSPASARVWSPGHMGANLCRRRNCRTRAEVEATVRAVLAEQLPGQTLEILFQWTQTPAKGQSRTTRPGGANAAA